MCSAARFNTWRLQVCPHDSFFNSCRCILLEKQSQLITGASQGNSALLHVGFDAKPGTVEQQCVREGFSLMMHLHKQLHVPVKRVGALIIAWEQEQLSKLADIVRLAAENGVHNCVQLTREQLLQREPNLSPLAQGAVYVPDEAVVDGWLTPMSYAAQAVANGAVIRRDFEVTGGMP